jgi:hypothetical protein
LNQISPDNYDRKSGELRELLIGNAKLMSEPGFNIEEAKNMTIDDEKQSIVVEIIFRKAQKEHSYTAFYAKLCALIIKLELESKGMQSKQQNAKHSVFRQKMLAYCKTSFESFFNDPPQVNPDINSETYEKEVGRIKKLYGNIEFCGDLHRHKILADATLWSVFEGLLGLSTGQGINKSVNDNTVEAALRLITKLGPSIDQSLLKPEWKAKNEATVDKIFKQFEYLMSPESMKPDKLQVS